MVTINTQTFERRLKAFYSSWNVGGSTLMLAPRI